MADLKISALNSLAGADLVAADVVAVVDDSASETKKLTVSDLIANGTTLISDATIPSAKILFSAGAIDTAELAASAVETAKINDSAVTAAKLADNSSVTLVSTLPGSGDFVGQLALDTDDNKVYAYNGSSWVSVKGAGSINVVSGSTSGIVNITTSTSGDTVTVSTTLDDTTAAAQFLAGPTGAAGTVGYRAIIGTDLPTATTTAKGGVIVNGEGLRMDSDTIEIDNDITANSSTFQAVKFDSKGLITSGRDIASADLPNATDGATGAVKPGTGLEMGTAGAIDHSNSVTGATNTKITYDAQGHVTAGTTLAASDIPDLDTAKVTTGTFPTARIADDAVTAAKLSDRSTATIAETTPAGGAFIGQTHLNSITGDYFLWDGNVWQPIGISVGEIILAGTYDASTNLMATVTSEGTALSFEVGSALPAASSSNKGYYVVVSEAGTGTSPAPTVALNPPDFLLSTGTAYTEIDVSSTVTAQQASNVAFTAAGNIAATNVQAAIEELDTEKVAAANPTLTGTVALGEDAVITFEGATSNDFETTLTVVDPTADRTLSLPNVTGTVVTTGDTGSVTSAMIADGAIVNADINASAEIAVSKLANGSARQLLQTASNGTDVEFTSNVDVPGTLDCTGAGTFDSTLTVTGVINADGKVKFPAGSASAPSFYSGTDTNTGLYFSAADEVSVATGGTQRVVVNSSGNLGVGATSPSTVLHCSATDAVLTLQGTRGTGASATIGTGGTNSQNLLITAGTDLYYRGASQLFQNVAGTTEYGRWDSSGRLLVGTTTARTDFYSGSLGADIQVEGSNFAAYSCYATNGNGAFIFGRDNGASGSTIGNLSWMADDGTDEVEAARISGQIDGTPGSNDMPGRLVFSTTADGASSPTERVRIDSSGRVGIGTGSPTTPLQVHSSATASTIRITNSTSGATSSDGLIIQENGNDTYIWNKENSFISFGTNNAERLRVDSSGNVGIGTSSPTSYANSQKTLVIEDSGNPAICWSDTGQTRDWWAVALGSALSFRYADGGGSGSASNVTSVLQLDNSGNVGIGTTSPADILHLKKSTPVLVFQPTADTEQGRINFINASGTFKGRVAYAFADNSLQFSTNGAEKVRIDSSGRLLCGTTSAVGGIGAGSKLQIRGNTAVSNGGGKLSFQRDQAAASIGTGEEVGQLVFSSNDGGDYALITSRSDGASSSTSDCPGRIEFSTTADGASSPTERMRISSKGVVTVKNSSVGEIDALTSASTITPDFAASNNFSVTLGTNATLANPSNLTAGQSGVIAITQDGTGSRTLAFGNKFKFAGGTAPTLTTTASAVDILTYYVESTSRITAQVLLNVS